MPEWSYDSETARRYARFYLAYSDYVNRHVETWRFLDSKILRVSHTFL